VRAFGIELVEEDIEAALLLKAVKARRAGRCMAVLLRAPRLDALDRNAEPQPSYRQL